MADTYVLAHGAWHTGHELEAVARHLRDAGHHVHCPTIAGNRREDDRSKIGLEDAIASIAHYLDAHHLVDVRLVGHSYGGMVITGVYDQVPQRIRRLVYVNAFVPNDGECLNDMVPPHYVTMFDAIQKDGAVMLPFEVWREAFINDADLTIAKSAYEQLNLHPYRTFTDPIRLKQPMAASVVGKSYVNCQQDTALPHTYPWHPRLSEKLGLFRLVETPGSHEMWFSAPARLAQAILEAGRD
jgi:pimeloyl-ACP methyl ester carboxylesterase